MQNRCSAHTLARSVPTAWLALLALAAAPADGRAEEYDQRSRAETLARDVAYSEPSAYESGLDGTRLTLNVCEVVQSLDGRPFRHRSYDGNLLGPIIRIRPGTTLAIRLENHLPAEISVPHDPNQPHGFNTTNLHTHGLHVSPEEPADDVLLEIPPGGYYEFRFDVPDDHPAGTFWYHAHKHGSTALQLASGMAGALIVEGGLDDILEIHAATERVLVLQQFVLREIPGEPWIVHPDDVYTGGGERVDTVNGVKVPTFTMRPGEVQRWRIIHAGIGDSMSLHLAGFEMRQIAVDGLATGLVEPIGPDGLELHPGQRSDVLVKAPTISEERQAYVLSNEVANARRNFRNRLVATTDLLKVVVSGPPLSMPWPAETALQAAAAFSPADVPQDHQLSGHWTLQFKDASTPDERKFLINDKAYSGLVERSIPLETAEEWRIEATAGGHPFHVHVNPFAVRESDSSGNVRWRWRDTLFVAHEEHAVIRSWFHTYPGQTVLHCHILDHEDLGMMHLIELTAPPATADDQSAVPEIDLDDTVGAALRSPAGEAIRSDAFLGQPLLLVLHRGLGCVHCSQQIVALTERRPDFAAIGVQLAAVSPELPPAADLAAAQAQLGIGFPLLTDPDLEVFRKSGCLTGDDSPRHGLLLFDARGALRWRHASEEPVLDMELLLSTIRRKLPGPETDVSADVATPLTD